MINRDVCTIHLSVANKAIQQKTPDKQAEVVFVYYNAKPHMAWPIKA